MSTNPQSLDAQVRDEQANSAQHVPPIVRIVLTQATRRRMRGQITNQKLKAQVARLSREELQPRGLSVQGRDLNSGTRRFFIRTTATGQVREMIEIRRQAFWGENA